MELYRHSTQLLCVRQDLTQITFQQFWQDVAQQCQAIKQMKPKTYALWEQSSYEFLVLLFAALQAEKEVLLPPHRIADLEQELAEQNIHFLSRQTCIPEINQTNELKFDDQFLNHAQIYFYTSGSTGQPKRIPRTLKQLMSEVAGLDASFHLPQQAIAIATVSHQHIYGLLFKVLWPLLTHRSFYDWQVAFPEDVVELQKTLSSLQIKNYVISSPALLKRWTSDVVLSNCDAVYSSGGKLDAGIRANLNVAISEIFGSSETGGIAYRHEDNALWTPFNDVEVKALEHYELAVKTCHACTTEWIVTGDQVELSDRNSLKSTFMLLGRLDRIVKLEEKRLSLDAIEQKILTLNFVEQVHVLILEKEARQILATVIVLNQQGREHLKMIGKVAFVHELKVQLATKLETIAIPRQWRFLTQLPQNSQSKLNKQYMKSIFEPMTQPVVINQFIDDANVIYTLEFIPELECFKGHFPENPIYPGVGQIGFIQYFAKQYWADLSWCNGYEQLKFQDLIKPHMILKLSLLRQDQKVTFELQSEEKTLASGRLLFAQDTPLLDA